MVYHSQARLLRVSACLRAAIQTKARLCIFIMFVVLKDTLFKGISDAVGISTGSHACERIISFVTAVPSELMTMTAAIPCSKACKEFESGKH